MPPHPSHPTILITAGPTQEPIDAVRYIGNRSSGTLGFRLAAAAAGRGASFTLLLGPVENVPSLEYSRGVVKRFRTSAELGDLLRNEWPRHDILFMAAAVADYVPIAADEAAKIRRRDDGELVLRLRPSADLLAGLIDVTQPSQVVVGFALEPHDELAASAQAKLLNKRVDAIVANPLETIGSNQIDATILQAGEKPIRFGDGPISKETFADALCEFAIRLWNARQPAPTREVSG